MSPLYLARSREIAARNFAGEMMIMSPRDSMLFNLNDVGTVIWEAADGLTPLEEIVNGKICAQFQVEAVQALQDAEEFVRELAERGILIISDHPIRSEQARKTVGANEAKQFTTPESSTEVR